MPSTVTRDHHNLRRNLKLNGNYISNDGGDEGVIVDDAGDVGVNIPTTITPSTKLEVFNQNVQYSTGTVYQSVSAIVGSGTTFTTAMVGSRFIFDDGTDAGIITTFSVSNVLVVSTSQTVGGAGDLRSYKIYYPSAQIDTGASSTTLKLGQMSLTQAESADGSFGASIAVANGTTSQGDLTLSADQHIRINADNHIYFNVGGTTVHFDKDGDTQMKFNLQGEGGASFYLYESAGGTDKLEITTAANGATIFTTTDYAGNEADMVFSADGYIDINSFAGEKIELDSGGDIILDADGDQVSMKFGGAVGQIDFSNENSGDGIIRQMVDAKDLVIQQFDGTEVARFTDGSKVGIGNSAPGSLLEVSKVSGSATLELSSWSATNTAAHAPALVLQKSAVATVNTFGDGSGTAASEILGRVEAWGATQDGTAADDIAKLSSYIEFANDAVSREGTVPGKIVFATAPDSDDAVPAVRMTLDDGGNLGIGEAAPQDTLEVNGTVLIKDALKFTQDDGNEFIDSQNDGYLDIGATTGIRLEAPTLCEDKLYFTQTDGNEYIDSLGDGYLDLDATTAIRFKSDIEATGDIKVTDTVYFAAETATTVGHLGTETIDWNVSQKQKLTITGTGITMQFTDPAGVCNLLLKVVQGDGSDVIGTWDSDILWAGGSAPTLSTGNGEIDTLSFYWDGSKYYGVASLDFS